MECFRERAKRNRNKRVIKEYRIFSHSFLLLSPSVCRFYLRSWHTRMFTHYTMHRIKRRRDEKSQSATGFRIGRLAGHKTWPRFKRIASSLSLFLARVFLLLSPFSSPAYTFLSRLVTPYCSTIAWLCILCITELWFMGTRWMKKKNNNNNKREEKKNVFINIMKILWFLSHKLYSIDWNQDFRRF